MFVKNHIWEYNCELFELSLW